MPLDESPPESARAAPAAPVPVRDLPVEFRGTAREYFGIWIVNLLLSILTLGIYSAWAKVRRKRFFLGSTYLDGHSFDYHATGWQILKGRILAVLYLVSVGVVQQLWPLAGLLITIPLLFVLPWVFNMSLRFNARMTSWRNVRFDFEGSYGKALVAFIVLPLVGMMSLGLLLPLATRFSAEYVARGHRYGTARFFATARLGPLYGAAGLSLLTALLTIAILAGAVLAFIDISSVFDELGREIGTNTDPREFDPRVIIKLQLLAFALMIPVFLGFYFASVFYRARVRNIVVNAMQMDGGHRFRSTLSGLRLIWILIGNFAATVVSVGLLRPWAAVRQYRYQCDCLRVEAAGDLDGFVSAARPAVGAFGSELVDFQNIDIGF